MFPIQIKKINDTLNLQNHRAPSEFSHLERTESKIGYFSCFASNVDNFTVVWPFFLGSVFGSAEICCCCSESCRSSGTLNKVTQPPRPVTLQRKGTYLDDLLCITASCLNSFQIAHIIFGIYYNLGAFYLQTATSVRSFSLGSLFSSLWRDPFSIFGLYTRPGSVFKSCESPFWSAFFTVPGLFANTQQLLTNEKHACS